MWKRFARLIVPGQVRRWYQQWNLDRHVRHFPRRVVEHDYGGVRLRVELADGLAVGWYDHDWPLPVELQLLAASRLTRGAKVFDLGAHQGVVGLMLGHRAGPTGGVLLVEANGHNVELCHRNVALNGMPWVRAVHAAVSDREGTVTFNTSLNAAAAELGDYARRVQVPAVTVDALAARYDRPDVVLVDVEGFECRVLAGAAATLAGEADWAVEVHVGCGLEAAGGSVERVLAHFPSHRFERFVHSEGEAAAIPLADAPADKLRDRFFLTALCKSPGAGG